MSTSTPPLATLAVFAYRHERFIREALASAFAQDYRPLEIIIVDDASPDGTAAVIEQELARYTGSVPVRFIRNTKNTGLMAAVNRVVAEAQGEVILFAAGDDVSLPSRTTETMRVFAADDQVNSVYTNATVVDAEGREMRLFYPTPPAPLRHDIWHAAREGFAILGASHSWRRSVFNVFGPLPVDVAFEDHAIPFRSGLLGRIEYLDQVLVRYREHGGNMFLGATGTASVAEWYKGNRRFAAQELATLRGRLVDLDVAERALPHRRADVERFRAITTDEIAQRVSQLRMYDGASWLERCRIILGHALKGLPRRRLARWILIFLFPRVYLRRLRRVTELAR